MSRRVFINLLAFFGVFVLMCWWAVNNILSFDFIERPYEISGEFAATAGVAANSEVAYLGVTYGSVRSVSMEGDKVIIEMAIDRDKRIPAGSRARIFRKSAVGEPFIDFAPPEDFEEGGPSIAPGERLGIEDTSVPLEFSELLRAASRLLAAVDPEQTRTLIHELAVALNGRGDALRDLTVSSDAMLQTFADRSELLDSLSANNTRLTRTVTERRDSLSSAIGDLAELAESLRTVEPETTVLLERGTELLGQTADLVSDVRGNLDCVLHDLDDVIDVTSTDANLASLAFTLDNAPTSLGFVWMTRDDEPGGLWVRVHLISDPSDPPEQYVPPTELPAVPEIPPCVSALDAGDDGDPVSSAGASTTVTASSAAVPATGGQPAQAASVVLLAGTAGAALSRRKHRRS